MSNTLPNNIGVVILAAGKGSRLNCVDTPKVMLEIGGKPIVSYIVDVLERMHVDASCVVMVVGFEHQKVEDYFGRRVTYAMQTERKGTAHAAYVGMQALPRSVDQVLVMGGDDSAFYTPQTIQSFVTKHIDAGSKLSLLTAEVDQSAQYGRIVRHDSGAIEIIEKEYVTEEQAKITEVSTGTFCFDRSWYDRIFPTMPQLRKLGEYGLPTALAVAREEVAKHQVVMIEDSSEWFGINTPEELEEAERRKSGSNV